MTPAVVNLGMYDLPEVREWTDRWWAGLARAFREAGERDLPERLDRSRGYRDAWRDRRLLFAQTCGYPMLVTHPGVMQLVATPIYDAPGCEGPHYRSLVIVAGSSRASSPAELRGTVFAYNGVDSQSGYNAPRALFAPLARDGCFFAAAVESGGHRTSIEWVRDGRADACAVDCVTHALLARHCPDMLEGTRVLCETAPAPALPYVTAGGRDPASVARLRDGLRVALADPSLARAREELLVAGAAVLDEDAYRPILDMESDAIARGYPGIG